MRKVLYLAVAAGGLAASPILAGMAQFPMNVPIDRFTCRQLLDLPAADQERAALYLMGFFDGQRRDLAMDVQRKAEVIDKMLQHCPTDPMTPVLDVFAKVVP